MQSGGTDQCALKGLLLPGNSAGPQPAMRAACSTLHEVNLHEEDQWVDRNQQSVNERRAISLQIFSNIRDLSRSGTQRIA